jgi:predicted O-methyltransferase YrrM
VALRGRARRVVQGVIGPERTDRLRTTERAWRLRAAGVMDPGSTRRAARWQPSDPFTTFPQPSLSRHALLRGLHERLQPERYLEIGVFKGDSLTLARCVSVGVDPDFKVTRELHGTTHLYRTTSDEFFARDNPLAVFDGQPVDLAFIDGMHLAEFALRDFINVERHMAPGGVVVLDDALPRNALEAARDRRTDAWAGDVFKVVTVLREHRPDLAVVPVNTKPTGTVVVLGLDPGSTVLGERYDELVPFLEAPDPQDVPEDLLTRSTCLDPGVLLDSVDWERLRRLRHARPDDPELRAVVDGLSDVPRLG